MLCNAEILQEYLDGELEPGEKDALYRHLAGCPTCRQELARLRLIWLELEQEDEIEIPFELPFIRQQVIARTKSARQEMAGATGVSFLEAQKLAWQPVLAGVAQIPGTRQLMRLARVTGMGLPAAIRGVSTALVVLAGRRRDRP